MDLNIFKCEMWTKLNWNKLLLIDLFNFFLYFRIIADYAEHRTIQNKVTHDKIDPEPTCLSDHKQFSKK